jgi:hypothetical protein
VQFDEAVFLDFCSYKSYIVLKGRKEDAMSPRTGRPTDERKELTVRLRMSPSETEILDYCCEKTGLTRSEVLRLGIQKVYEGIKE